jgi:hypothetical protein
MSYDLFVFEPQDNLRERRAFLEWYHTQTNWLPGIDYTNPKNATPALRAWYVDMIDTFLPINGPDRPPIGEIAQHPSADYCVGPMFIYVAFAGLNSRNAYKKTVSLAARHRVGFFDASGNSEVWFPKSTGEELEMLHERQDSDPPGRFATSVAQSIESGEAPQVKSMEEFVQLLIGDKGPPRE